MKKKNPAEIHQLDSFAGIKQLLSENGLSPSKKFGQNFLVPRQIRDKVVSILGPEPSDRVWEIGPGIGSMTTLIAPRCAEMVLFEIDHGFIRLLENLLSGFENWRIIEGNFLKTGIPLLEGEAVPDKIFGNLPYSSGSAMIFKMVETGNPPGKAVFTLQKEVCDRITANPGTKDYSLFTLVCGSLFTPRAHDIIHASSFYPVPDVVSRTLELVPRSDRLDKHLHTIYMGLAKDMFRVRRKTIKNNMKGGEMKNTIPLDAILQAGSDSGISPDRRGETVSVDELSAWSKKLGPAYPA